MVFAYTVDTPDGIRTGTTYIHDTLQLKTGTWTATGVTNGEIVTGLTHVIAYKTNVSTGTIGSEHTSKPNVNGGGTASEGSIGILVTVAANTGKWMAIGY